MQVMKKSAQAIDSPSSEEDVSLEDMMIEDNGEDLELVYPCRCADYFSVDSMELGQMGYTLLKDGNTISMQNPYALPASIILPCSSCSLQVSLLINADINPPIDDQ
ncbi:hypothetical protein Q3G72_009115 [Acer saccharum]|nr:hypothetical protein Q3G72_009115 [Acer saccharum]